jgi:hypothetical protein
MNDLLYIHGSNDDVRGGGKIVNQLSPLFQPNALREPRHHLMEVYPGSQVHGGKDDIGPLPYPCHHCLFTILYHDELPPMGSDLTHAILDTTSSV